jgi:hypothetical protein
MKPTAPLLTVTNGYKCTVTMWILSYVQLKKHTSKAYRLTLTIIKIYSEQPSVTGTKKIRRCQNQKF